MSHTPLICMYFQVHQPHRLRDLRVRDIGSVTLAYFDDEKNRAIFRKVAEKCYLPTNTLMLDLLKRHPEMSIAYSLSGVFLDQCALYGQDVLDSFQALAKTGQVEFLAETYYHSLSSIVSLPEFCDQVGMHVKKIEELFGQTPQVFRNTELIYNNEIAQIARLMGFSGIIAEGADHLLQGRNPNVPYVPPAFRLSADKEKVIREKRPLQSRSKEIRILLKNYRLSDDIAFRFSDKNWKSYPLFSDTYAGWLASNNGHSVNLFMDYETFGEHQWADTGIFNFLESLPDDLNKRGMHMRSPSQVLDGLPAAHEPDTYDAHTTISWADLERDLSAWQGNHIQTSAMNALYAMEHDVKVSGDAELLDIWRNLQTSDHFYYMCTKHWADGDVHKYFSPYDSPYEAYRRFSHALCDLKTRVTLSSKKDIPLT